jgi:hypothetical protein
MKELSLHILDIVQNSLKAEAKQIVIDIKDSAAADKLEITIKDDGCGMAPDFLERVTEPFTTTRTTRKMGMGLPLLKMAAELANGTFSINSTLGTGTSVYASFVGSHLDTPPVGDMIETIVTLVHGAPDVDFSYSYEQDNGKLTFATAEIREILEDLPLNHPEVLVWLRGHLKELEISELKRF